MLLVLQTRQPDFPLENARPHLSPWGSQEADAKLQLQLQNEALIQV